MPTNNFPGIGYKTQGVDFNFFQKLVVSAATFGGGSVDGYQPDMIIKFPTQGVIFNVQGVGGANVIEYSFNGTTVHGELSQVSASNRYFLTFNNREISMIWFRVQSGSSSATVTVEAWSTR